MDESNVVDESKLNAVAMAQDAMTWAEVAPDFGEIWEFEEGVPLIGMLTARRKAEVPDESVESGKRETMVYDIVRADDKERYSIWGSWSLDNKLMNVPDGAIVRITWKGKEDFKADDGSPRTVNRFRVDVAAIKAAEPSKQE